MPVLPPDKARRRWGGLIIKVWWLQASTSDIPMQVSSGFRGFAFRASGTDMHLAKTAAREDILPKSQS